MANTCTTDNITTAITEIIISLEIWEMFPVAFVKVEACAVCPTLTQNCIHKLFCP